MIIKEGNIVTQVTSGVILHQVNCQGVMGSGVARDIRNKYPKVFEEYSRIANPASTSRFAGADLLGIAQCVDVTPELSIFNLFGQQFYGREPKRYTSYDALDTALAEVANQLRYFKIESNQVNLPLLGSGLGGAHWPTVATMVEHHLGPDTTLWVLPTS